MQSESNRKIARRLTSTGAWFSLFLLGVAFLTGCTPTPAFIPPEQRHEIDRRIMEYPQGFKLETIMTRLTCPTAFCFDESGNTIVAEGGIDHRDPRIFILHPDGTQQTVYPLGTRIPFVKPGFRIYGPVDGMTVYKGLIYVGHRDAHDMGVITAFTYSGQHKTVVADLPAQGDFGVTDLAIPNSSADPRLYFGVGAATNSGVVGLDNWQEGWVREHRKACDLAYQPLNLLGFRFDVPNPEASLFAPSTLVTVPYAPLGTSDVLQIPAVQFPIQKPSGAIFSVGLDGGDLRVEAWGVRDPEGIAVDSYGAIYLTDRGMELRGTRPIDQDPDGLYKLTPFTGPWLGWPDWTRDFQPVSTAKYQPPSWMVLPTGYPDVGFVIDHAESKLSPPDPDLLKSNFPWQSGAAKMTFFPHHGPFHLPKYEGQMLVALWGDRAPFSTTGRTIPKPLPGYRISLVDLNARNQISDFIYNTQGGPASQLSDGSRIGLERPIDVKFGPDGNLYILDFGQATFKHGHLKIENGTGKIYELSPVTK